MTNSRLGIPIRTATVAYECPVGSKGPEVTMACSSKLVACMETGGINILVHYLNLEDMICLACSSRAIQKSIQPQLSTDTKRLACQLLADWVLSEHTHDRLPYSRTCNAAADVNRSLQQVQWLVRQAGSLQHVLQDGCLQMLKLRDNIKFSIASALVANGLRFTYQQLISAVQAGVQGVEVWMQAYRKHGIPRPADMPREAEALCCNDRVDFHHAAHNFNSSISDLLQLAVAMPVCSVATGALQDICESGGADKLSVEELCQLLTAATKLGHSCQVNELLNLPAAKHLTPPDLLPLMQSAIRDDLIYALRSFSQLPAAADLSVDQIYDLLHQAILMRSSGSVRVICDLPAADALPAAAVRRLMQIVDDDQQQQQQRLQQQGPQQQQQQQQGVTGSRGLLWALFQLPVAVQAY